MRNTRDILRRALAAMGLACLLSGFGISLAFTDRLAGGSSVAILAVGVLAVSLSPLIWRVATGRFDLLEPLVPAAAMLALLFGVRPLVMLATDDLTFDGYYMLGSNFPRAVSLGALGTVLFVLGYECVVHQKGDSGEAIASVRQVADRSRLHAFAMGCVAVGLGLFVVHLALGGSILQALRLLAAGRSNELSALYSGSSEYLTAAPLLPACAAMVLIAASSPYPSRSTLIRAAMLVAIPVVVFFAVGTRRFIIPSALLPIIIYYLLSCRRPSVKACLMVLPVVFIFLATLPVARSAGAREQAGGLAPLFSEAASKPNDSIVGFVTGLDTSMVAALTMELDTLDRTDHYYWGRATLGDFLLAPIPSAVIHKPETARNQFLTEVTGRPCDVGAGGSCPDFSVVGTLYQDFGFLGVAIGMFLLGAAAASMWRRFVLRPFDPARAVLAACTAVLLPIVIRAGLMPAAAWFLFFSLPALFGLAYVFTVRVRVGR